MQISSELSHSVNIMDYYLFITAVSAFCSPKRASPEIRTVSLSSRHLCCDRERSFFRNYESGWLGLGRAEREFVVNIKICNKSVARKECDVRLDVIISERWDLVRTGSRVTSFYRCKGSTCHSLCSSKL